MNFIKKVCKVIFNTIKEFVLDLWKNVFSVSILVLSSCGLCTILSKLPITILFISIPFINETAIISILSIVIIYLIVSIIPIWEKLCLTV